MPKVTEDTDRSQAARRSSNTALGQLGATKYFAELRDKLAPEEGGAGRAGRRQERRPAPAGAVGAGGALLGTTQTTDRQNRQARRWAAREACYGARTVMWDIPDLPERMRACGRDLVEPKLGGVGLRITEAPTDEGPEGRTVGLSNVATCGSVACPCCSSKIAGRRMEELEAVLHWIVKHGGTVVMVTLTMRHKLGDRLDEQLDAISDAWHNAVSGGGWFGDKRRTKKGGVRQIGDKARYGVLGWAKVVEPTWGAEAGWHAHVHGLIFLDRQISMDTAEALGHSMWERWDAGLRNHSKFHSLENYGGVDVRIGDTATEKLAGYLCKEALYGHTKVGKLGNRSPFQMLAGFIATGDLADMHLFVDYVLAIRGRKQITWSGGIRELAGLAKEEAKDEEIAAEDLGEKDWLVVPTEHWNRLRWISWGLLNAAEQGIETAQAWLDVRGIPYEVFHDVIAEARTEWLPPKRSSARGESRRVLAGL